MKNWIFSRGIFFFFFRGAAFSHVRMIENVEISNPMYLRGEDLDETEDPPDLTGNSRVGIV